MTSAMGETHQAVATVMISWGSFSNEDIGKSKPDEGWYVSVEVDERSFDLGPDMFGPGCKTFDDALALVRKWAEGRNLKVNTDIFTLPVFGHS